MLGIKSNREPIKGVFAKKLREQISWDSSKIDAYHDKDYSAIPFYEKCGFFALQEFSEEYDSLRMAYRV